ncbi:hypothetical protein GMRT_10580 [Giardia muris]|uniref:Uncharacterized protein n=1 Tax=Giardia muris TaxID=5742 RepID=A0A4Z1T355_GIAMU|nr:hypothetical protein GMRT_10580 [Giardia muris]|eukprot:TNJ26841.1 hypothetical protein GMRT_10580 [Giardia muris]
MTRGLVLAVVAEAEAMRVSSFQAIERMTQLFLLLEAERITLPEFSTEVSRLDPGEGRERLSQAAIDTLLETMEDDVLQRFVWALLHAAIRQAVSDPDLATRFIGAADDLLDALGLDDRPIVTFDEVLLLVLSVVKPNECGDLLDLLGVVQGSCDKLRMRGGRCAYSTFILHLIDLGLTPDAIYGSALIIRGMQIVLSPPQCALSLVLEKKINEKVQTFLSESSRAISLLHGVYSVDDTVLGQLLRAFDTEVRSDEDPLTIREHLKAVLRLREDALMTAFQTIQAGQQSVQDTYVESIQSAGELPRWEDLCIDELLMRADWVALPVTRSRKKL